MAYPFSPLDCSSHKEAIIQTSFPTVIQDRPRYDHTCSVCKSAGAKRAGFAHCILDRVDLVNTRDQGMLGQAEKYRKFLAMPAMMYINRRQALDRQPFLPQLLHGCDGLCLARADHDSLDQPYLCASSRDCRGRSCHFRPVACRLSR